MSRVYSPYLGRYVPYIGPGVYTFRVTEAGTGTPVANAQCALSDAPLIIGSLEGVGGYTDLNGVCTLDAPFIARYYSVYKAGYVTARGSIPGTQINVSLTPTAVKYWVSIHAGIGGTVDPSGTYQVAANTKITVTATPETGYVLDYWTINNVNSGSTNPLSMTVDRDGLTVWAIFKETGVPPPPPPPPPPPNGGGTIKTVTILSNKLIDVPLLWNGNSHTEPINLTWDSAKTTITRATLSARAYSNNDAMQMDLYLNAAKVGDMSWPAFGHKVWKETTVDVTGRLAKGNNNFKFDYYFTWLGGRSANAWVYADLILEYTGDEPTAAPGAPSDPWAWVKENWMWIAGGGVVLGSVYLLTRKGQPLIVMTQPYYPRVKGEEE
ncbi:MAG: hypothetical protein Q8O76_04455 [Chloroflexota bacterium]|nr:hypothetical protein [Chloroflexota bacterium]